MMPVLVTMKMKRGSARRPAMADHSSLVGVLPIAARRFDSVMAPAYASPGMAASGPRL
jgi:hypothetical protein